MCFQRVVENYPWSILRYGQKMVENRKQFWISVKNSFGRCLLSEIKSDLISYGSEVKGGVSYPPELTLEKSRDHWYLFSFFPLDLFHLWPQIWAHMGPYGPVYHYMLLLYDLYIVFTLFLYDFRWFETWLFRLFTYIESSFYIYIFYHILIIFQGSFL